MGAYEGLRTDGETGDVCVWMCVSGFRRRGFGSYAKDKLEIAQDRVAEMVLFLNSG